MNYKHFAEIIPLDDFAAAIGFDYQDHLDPDIYFAGDRVALVLRIENRAIIGV